MDIRTERTDTAAANGDFVLFDKQTVAAEGSESGFHPYALLILTGRSPLDVTVGTTDEFTLPAQTALFLSPYVLYSIAPRSCATDTLSVNFAAFGSNFTASPFWQETRTLLEHGKCGLHFQTADAEPIYRIYREIDNSFSLEHLNKIICLTAHLTANLPAHGLIDCRNRVRSSNVAFCRTVNQYIHEHISRKGSVSEAAEKSHMSVSNFHQKFRRCFKESFHSYLLKQKIRTACNLLAGTSMTVAEIAEKLDFNSPSHFTVIFKQHRHTTPAAYRTRTRKGDGRSPRNARKTRAA